MKRDLARPRGRIALWIALVLIGALVGQTLLWRWAEQRLRSGFDAWVAGRREQGWRVGGAEPVAAGWPFAARLIVKQASVEGGEADIPGGFAWRVERITLAVALFQPRLLAILPEGEQHLRLGHLPDIPYTADRLRVDTPLEPGARTDVADVADVAADRLRVGIPGARASAALDVGLLRVHAEFRPSARRGEPALATSVSAEAITLPPRLPWAFGDRISSASVDGEVSGPLPPAPSPVQRAQAWRDGGGTVDLRHVALGWGPLGVTGGAALGLDERMQPRGTGTARFVGYAEALDELASGGVITARTAFAVKAVAGLIASAPAGGGRAVVEAPLILQDGTLSVRQIPLARVPSIPWPPA